uniref:Uncharacterized protein n=1 Tax=Anopheles farauti TaxID=69004 RepID=A0A182Q3J6_9DIPT
MFCRDDAAARREYPFLLGPLGHIATGGTFFFCAPAAPVHRRGGFQRHLLPIKRPEDEGGTKKFSSLRRRLSTQRSVRRMFPAGTQAPLSALMATVHKDSGLPVEDTHWVVKKGGCGKENFKQLNKEHSDANVPTPGCSIDHGSDGWGGGQGGGKENSQQPRLMTRCDRLKPQGFYLRTCAEDRKKRLAGEKVTESPGLDPKGRTGF